jgi:hypothetical protein
VGGRGMRSGARHCGRNLRRRVWNQERKTGVKDIKNILGKIIFESDVVLETRDYITNGYLGGGEDIVSFENEGGVVPLSNFPKKKKVACTRSVGSG